MNHGMTQKRCVVVGAGFAGAATAYHLTQMGMNNVIVLEQEAVPGMHASGRNAAMVRQVVSGEPASAMARGGAAFLRHLPDSWPIETSFQQTGSFLLADERGVKQLQNDALLAKRSGIEVEWLSLDQIIARVPVLEGSPTVGGVWCPSDGVIDIHALIHGYLRAAMALGAEVRFSEKIKNIITRGNRVVAVHTDAHEFETDMLVDAAGAWAGEIAKLAGAC